MDFLKQMHPSGLRRTHRRGINNGNGLNDLLLVRLGAGAVQVANNRGHASLVAEGGRQVDRLLGVILGEAVKDIVSMLLAFLDSLGSPSENEFLLVDFTYDLTRPRWLALRFLHFVSSPYLPLGGCRPGLKLGLVGRGCRRRRLRLGRRGCFVPGKVSERTVARGLVLAVRPGIVSGHDTQKIDSIAAARPGCKASLCPVCLVSRRPRNLGGRPP